jgi:two-component system phosphate regulon sensor histidine kinase PhoR
MDKNGRDMTFENLISVMPIACLIVNRRELVVHFNSNASEILNKPSVNTSFVNYVRHPDIVAAVEHVFDGGAHQSIMWRTSQHNLDVAYSVHVRRIDDDHVLISFEDLTQADQLRQQRRDFVSNVSHELRTPLTSILGFLETIKTVAKNDPVAQDRFIDIMTQEAERMNRLVNDLLSLNQVESKEYFRPTDRVDLKAVISETVENLMPTLARHENHIDLEMPTDQILVMGDHDQLRQVVTNLIENAIKYGGPRKTVHVALGPVCHQSQLRGDGIALSIRDEGEGIASHHISRLTERFYRVDSHRSREVGGTGLGLSIVKHILSRHRGRLVIESTLGKGSTFSVYLPK